VSVFKVVYDYFDRRSIKAKISIAKRYIIFIAGDHSIDDQLKAQFILNALKHIKELEILVKK
jgi:hypothetical protein